MRKPLLIPRPQPPHPLPLPLPLPRPLLSLLVLPTLALVLTHLASPATATGTTPTTTPNPPHLTLPPFPSTTATPPTVDPIDYNLWQQMTPAAQGPGPLAFQSASWAPDYRRGPTVVVFGGLTSVRVSGDTISDSATYTDQLWLFSIVTLQWYSPPTTGAAPSARAYHMGAVLALPPPPDSTFPSYYLIVAGGRVNNTVLADNTVYMLDLQSFVWTQLAPSASAPTQRWGAGNSVVLTATGSADVGPTSGLFVMGGACALNSDPTPVPCDTTLYYLHLEQAADPADPPSGSWTRLALPPTAPQPSPRMFFAMQYFDGLLVVGGGWDVDNVNASALNDTWIGRLTLAPTPPFPPPPTNVSWAPGPAGLDVASAQTCVAAINGEPAVFVFMGIRYSRELAMALNAFPTAASEVRYLTSRQLSDSTATWGTLPYSVVKESTAVSVPAAGIGQMVIPITPSVFFVGLGYNTFKSSLLDNVFFGVLAQLYDTASCADPSNCGEVGPISPSPSSSSSSSSKLPGPSPTILTNTTGFIWTPVSSTVMPDAVTFGASAMAGGVFHVIGGWGETFAESSNIWSLDAQRIWRKWPAELTPAVAGAKAAVLANDRVVLVGGGYQNRPGSVTFSHTVYMFQGGQMGSGVEAITNPSFPPRRGHSLVAVPGSTTLLVLFGGYSCPSGTLALFCENDNLDSADFSQQTLWIINTAALSANNSANPTGPPPGWIDMTNRTSTLQPPSPRALHTAVVLGNSMYVFGGLGADEAFDELWQLDLSPLVALGGLPSTTPQAMSELIHGLQLSWSMVTLASNSPAPTARWMHCALPLDDSSPGGPTRMAMFGGDGRQLNTTWDRVWVFTSTKSAWDELVMTGFEPNDRQGSVCGNFPAAVANPTSRSGAPIIFSFGGQERESSELSDYTYYVYLACNAGHYSPYFESQACQPCSAGTYADSSGRAICETCPVSTSTSVEGATAESQCDICSDNHCGQGSCTVGLAFETKCKCHTGYSGATCQTPLLTIVLVSLFGVAMIAIVVYLIWRYHNTLMETDLALKERLLEERDLDLMAKETELLELNRVFQIDERDIHLGRRIDSGVGAFGEVWVGKYNGLTVAVKILLEKAMLFSDDIMLDFQREVDSLKHLRHHNIVLFYGAGVMTSRGKATASDDVDEAAAAAAASHPGGSSQHSDVHLHIPGSISSSETLIQQRPFLVTEYFARGSLADILKRETLTWKQKIAFALETAQGMNFLHCLNPPRIHRDLKVLFR